ncbi:hypothetical protein [Streptomyces sp. NPDC056683]|uniref:hypothetical protein n=1 Tax=Streptomyces sp. NPDC056683 TaxID=3345910 RepID=UPI0036AC070A
MRDIDIVGNSREGNVGVHEDADRILPHIGRTQFLAAVVVIEGPHIGWTTPAALTGYAWAAVAAAGFVPVESRRPEPLMDLRLFRRPVFSGAFVDAVAVFIALRDAAAQHPLPAARPAVDRAASTPVAYWSRSPTPRSGPRCGGFTSPVPR